ncbi:hypothetical protein PpBr36_01648 [Pyricularia pennisetigena]|uniref:hypothetical protein n=1 Tax=Pyricularia pennisetigena TaxID=1578925 RepID=UPI00114EA01E|nr:hypothetical protein PpBr36_01648 [Pyricularia pennisetigena]TLS27704.1 hypothetical protein PpBr36_01648 [Pyricularia pennisetigena]
MLAEIVVFSIRCGPREVPPVLPNLVRGLPWWRGMLSRKGHGASHLFTTRNRSAPPTCNFAHEPVRGERPNRLVPPMKTYSRKRRISRQEKKRNKKEKKSQCRNPPTPISNLFACVLLEPPRRLLESRLKVENQV